MTAATRQALTAQTDWPERVDRAIGLGEQRLAGVQAAISAVDAKASLTSTVQAAGLGALLTAPGRGGVLWLAGLLGLLAAAACSAAVVFPRLTGRTARLTYDCLYFGELRLWSPTGLASRLMTMSDTERLDGLTRQLVTVSRIAWRKHRLLQASLLTTAPSAVLLALGGLL